MNEDFVLWIWTTFAICNTYLKVRLVLAAEATQEVSYREPSENCDALPARFRTGRVRLFGNQCETGASIGVYRPNAVVSTDFSTYRECQFK